MARPAGRTPRGPRVVADAGTLAADGQSVDGTYDDGSGPVATPFSTLDLVPDGGGATHPGIYDIVDATMRIH